jgi:hypothetical protein
MLMHVGFFGAGVYVFILKLGLERNYSPNSSSGQDSEPLVLGFLDLIISLVVKGNHSINTSLHDKNSN